MRIILSLWLGVLLQPLMAEPLSAIERGEQVFNNRDKGHCLLCHSLSSNPETFQGNLGPSLDDVAKRLDRDELTLRIADSREVNPNTIMPPYYSVINLSQVAPEFDGDTVLTEQELSDLVSYLIHETDDK